MRKKICLLYNHFQLQDGVNRSAMDIANEMVKRDDVEITLIPIYTFDKECFKFLDQRVKVKKRFGFYFRGLGSIMSRYAPPRLLYKGLGEKIIASMRDLCLQMSIKEWEKLCVCPNAMPTV